MISTKIKQPTSSTVKRNEGTPFNIEFLNDIRVNRSAVERRVATIGTRRSVKKEWQAAWLLKAVSCIDLTTLAGDDTPGNVQRLCAKARNPVRQDILLQLGMEESKLQTGAVCVYHNLIPEAKKALEGTDIPIAAVSTGFPAGQVSLEQKIKQIELSVAAGATEIDIVISRSQVLTGDWKSLYKEVSKYRKACGESHMKTILAT